MKTWLILYIMTIGSDGSVVSGHWVERAHKDEKACSVALDRAITEWERLVAEGAKAGIIGRCSDRPLGTRST